MKVTRGLISLAVLALLKGSWSFAACTLDRPIELGSLDLVKQGLVLRNVEFDQEPRFTTPSRYDSSTDALSLEFFEVIANGERTGRLGAMVEAVGRDEVVGFSEVYVGEFAFAGSQQTQGDVTAYTSLLTEHFNDPQSSRKGAVTRLIATVDHGKLISVELQIPVFRGVGSPVFTGDHQILCLKSAH